MSNLFFAIDSIDEAYRDSDFLSALDEAMLYGKPADLSDLHTEYVQDGMILRDTGVLVEYFDGDEYGFGIVTDWTINPFDLYDNETDEDYAYILRDNGGSTYAHYHSLRAICEVNRNDDMEHSDTLSVWATSSTSNESHSAGQNNDSDMPELPYVAGGAIAMALGA